MAPLGVVWWIAGGWALDLHLGRQTREHADIDVGVARRDHLRVQSLLACEWQLFKAHQSCLAPWPAAEELREPVHDVWARRDERSPWAFQLMLVEVRDGLWIYRRLPEIRLPLAEVLAGSRDGVPYLRPEVQLLYKGGSSSRRPRDLEDLRRMLPALSAAQVAWLRASLARQFPHGHKWLAELG